MGTEADDNSVGRTIKHMRDWLSATASQANRS
jgi:hypothetical protein